MKKFLLASLFILITLISISGCGGSKNNPPTTETITFNCTMENYSDHSALSGVIADVVGTSLSTTSGTDGIITIGSVNNFVLLAKNPYCKWGFTLSGKKIESCNRI